MSTDQWTRVEQSLPPENALVDTISPGGIQQTLRRRGNLWFVPDGSMYIYYTPMMWRKLDGEP